MATMTLQATGANAAANGFAATLNYAGSAYGYMSFQTVGNLEVARCNFATTAFKASSNGIIQANAISSDTDTVAGVITKCILYSSTNTPIASCTVGTSVGSGIVLSSTTFAAHERLDVTNLNIEFHVG